MIRVCKIGKDSLRIYVNKADIRSLVVSFKTNNSYLRWWEGRNVWTNITTNSRQLGMLIWLQVGNSSLTDNGSRCHTESQVPNRPKPKEDDKKDDKHEDSKEPQSVEVGHSDMKGDTKAYSVSSADSDSDKDTKCAKKVSHDPNDPAAEHLLAETNEGASDDRQGPSLSDQGSMRQKEEENKERDMLIREGEELEGLIEKKTYINLVNSIRCIEIGR